MESAIAEMDSYLATPIISDFGLHLHHSAPQLSSHPPFTPSPAPFSPALDPPFDSGAGWASTSIPTSTTHTPHSMDAHFAHDLAVESARWMAAEPAPQAPSFDPPPPPSSGPISRWAGYGDGWGFEISDGQYI